jgi:hypothetical protein
MPIMLWYESSWPTADIPIHFIYELPDGNSARYGARFKS